MRSRNRNGGRNKREPQKNSVREMGSNCLTMTVRFLKMEGPLMESKAIATERLVGLDEMAAVLGVPKRTLYY